MNRGCVIALIVFGVSVLLFCVLVIGVPLFMFDIIRSAPRVAVTAFQTEDTVAAFRIDPNQSQLLAIFNRTGGRFDWFFPHEAGFFVDLDKDRKTRTLTLAGSPKHFGPLFMMVFAAKDSPFHPEDLEISGIDHWLTPKPTREKGAIILRGTGPVTPEDEQTLPEPVAEATPRQPAKLQGTHALEFVAQNRNYEALLAVAPFIRENEESDEATDKDTDPEAAASEAEAADTSEKAASTPAAEATPDSSDSKDDAHSVVPEADAKSPADVGDASEKEISDIAALWSVSDTINIVGDFTGADEFTLTTAIGCRNDDALAKVKTQLELVETEEKNWAAENGVKAAFTTTVANTTLTHKVVLSGFEKSIVRWIEEQKR